jgi:hypothetical protein
MHYTTALIYQLQYSRYKLVCRRTIRRYIVIPTNTISRCIWRRYRVIATDIVIPTDRQMVAGDIPTDTKIATDCWLQVFTDQQFDDINFYTD